MDKRRDLPGTVPNTVPAEGDASASPCGHAGDGLEAWLADRRWRAALESHSSLAERKRDRLDLPGRGSAG